jgi:hypothetical protein
MVRALQSTFPPLNMFHFDLILKLYMAVMMTVRIRVVQTISAIQYSIQYDYVIYILAYIYEIQKHHLKVRGYTGLDVRQANQSTLIVQRHVPGALCWLPKRFE